MDTHSLLLLAGGLLVFLGLVGSILPGLPGLGFIFLGALLIAWTGSFSRVGWVTLLVLLLLTAAGFAVDFLAAMLGAKRVGASKLAVIGAALGTLGGLFFALPGLLLGPFLGAVAGEALHLRQTQPDWARLGKVGLGAWLGFIVGTVLKLLLALAMMGLLIAVYFSGA